MKRIYPKRYIVTIVILSVMLGLFMIPLCMIDDYSMLEKVIISLLIGALFYHIGASRIVLREEQVILVSGLKRWKISYDDIELVRLGYRQVNASNSIPALLIQYKAKKKPAYLYHRKYADEDIIEMLSSIKAHHQTNVFCKNTQALCRGQQTTLGKQYEKKEKRSQLLGLFFFLLIIVGGIIGYLSAG